MDLSNIEIERLHYPQYVELLVEALNSLPLEIDCGGKVCAKYRDSIPPSVIFDVDGKIENIKIGKSIFPRSSYLIDGTREVWLEYKDKGKSIYNIILRITQ